MTTNESLPMEPEKTLPAAVPPDTVGTPPKKEKREISKAERLLLPVSLVIAVLYDRLLFAPIFDSTIDLEWAPILSGVFWLCYLILFYLFYWKKIKHDRISWFIAGCCAALSAWNFFFGRAYENSGYSLLTYLILPAVLMAHAQFSTGGYRLKEAGKIALAWLCGWFIKPFSGIPVFLAASGSLILGENKSTARKVLLGVGITLPVLGVIIPLLCGADRVFGYYIDQWIGSWDLGSLILHAVVMAVAFGLFYSFLWNTGTGEGGKETLSRKTAFRVDAVICYIVLGTVNALYILFCAVQFTYLFAGAGLPNNMTYSEYAREGFAQTVAVCAMNLLILGVFLQFGAKGKITAVFLTGLLGLTGVMLFSGFIRLKLYIDAYGLTWLRLLSAWFVVYLVAVIIVCGIRMLRAKLPAIALCALILLGWYVVLGYSSPDTLVERYNQVHHYDRAE